MNELTQRKRFNTILLATGLGSVAMFVVLLFCGTVDIPASEIWAVLTGGEHSEISEMIVHDLRMPMACCAFLSGMALSVAGLLLQTTFNNPLAGPSVLGVSTGASLGVAVITLLLGGGAAVGFDSYVGSLFGAIVGAGVMLLLLLGFSKIVKGTAMLLIVGILQSYLASSVISILNFYATEEGVHSFVIWGLGSFAGVTPSELLFFAPIILLTTIGSALMVKPLNALLLGSGYAESMGVNLRATRNWLLLISGLLTAAVTAFCGPIGFLGLVMPHVARLTLRSSNHNRLLPATALWGGFAGLLCCCISLFAGNGGLLPINAITPLISVPIIIYVIINRDKLSYFR
jgi:iron complex transport system permease protein